MLHHRISSICNLQIMNPLFFFINSTTFAPPTAELVVACIRNIFNAQRSLDTVLVFYQHNLHATKSVIFHHIRRH